MDTRKGIEHKRGNKNKVEINDALKRRAAVFNYRIKKLSKEKHFRKQIEENRNKLIMEFRYETNSSIDNALKFLNELLFDFRFVNDKNILKGRGILRANKMRLSQLFAGKLTKIQCRPFKNGMTLVLETAFEEVKRLRVVNGAKVEQKVREKTVKIAIKLAHEETDELIILENMLWQGSEDGLHKKKKEAISEEGAFDKVSVKKW